MRKDGGADYALVRGLTRGLDLLKALNSQEGGRSTLAQLAEVTGLHRTTVRRLLETLIAEGYVVGPEIFSLPLPAARLAARNARC